MKHIILRLTACLSLLVTFSAHAQIADKFYHADKISHAIVGAGISASVTAYTQDADDGFYVGVAVGGAKEIMDRMSHGRHLASWRDFVATGVGAYAGSRVACLYIVPGGFLYRRTVNFF